VCVRQVMEGIVLSLDPNIDICAHGAAIIFKEQVHNPSPLAPPPLPSAALACAHVHPSAYTCGLRTSTRTRAHTHEQTLLHARTCAQTFMHAHPHMHTDSYIG
jgi:hypothetical protein